MDRARQFHQALSEYYTKNSELASNEKMQVLLTYMSRHEQNMVEALARYEDGASKKVLNTWFKYPPEMKHAKCFECLELSPDMSPDDIMETALRVDQCLVALYKQAAEKSVSQDVKDLFKQLLAMEQKEETKALRDALHYDQES
ncbi:MAG TPA: hypothetical protein DCZ95_10865 [Verrucomicrobia bacterium]|nr:hypothetical protein [Verrucomicrobiota bacterium]